MSRVPIAEIGSHDKTVAWVSESSSRGASLDDPAYSSTSEAELDSDHEPELPEDEVDPQKLLGAWLGELDSIQGGLDHVPAKHPPVVPEKMLASTPRLDGYRFSMVNLEESQDVELDAILGELCALETQFEREINQKGHSRCYTGQDTSAAATTALHLVPPTPVSSAPVPGTGVAPLGSMVSSAFGSGTSSQRSSGHSRSSSSGGGSSGSSSRPRFELGPFHEGGSHGNSAGRTDSPDNDSAFSDNVSMLSSESSASSGGGGVGRSSHHDGRGGTLTSKSCRDQGGVALASSPTQLFIKAFSADNSAKSLLVDERMTIAHVSRLLADKNHVPMDPKWVIIEHIPQLYMERIYEDHENLVENLLLWTRESNNRILFLEREEKYDLFVNPENYLLSGASSEKSVELDDDSKIALVEEFFASSGAGVPEVEGVLYLKSDGKKAWKKHFCVLRASGLYYCPKGKSKLSKDLVCLTTFEMNNIYVGIGWKKKYKAPTDFGFAIKHPQIQTKSSKYIKYLCAEDEKTLRRWVTGCRLAKYGKLIKENYDNLMRDIVEEDLETLAHARSFSVSSMAKTLAAVSPDHSSGDSEPNSPSGLPSGPRMERRGSQDSDSAPTITASDLASPTNHPRSATLLRKESILSSSSGSSSGFPSERSGSATPTAAEQMAFFDAEVGTIKRKPSMTPKIPLTNTTRTLAKQSGLSEETDGFETVGRSGSGSLGRSSGARMSLRRSHTDERISIGTLPRMRQGSLPCTADIKQAIQRTRSDATDSSPPSPRPQPSEASPSLDITEALPPPPDLAGSTLSLDSLPPPPPPLELSEVNSWPSTSSLNSLPPPPSPLVTPTNSPTLRSPLSSPRSGRSTPTNGPPAVPPKPRSPENRIYGWEAPRRPSDVAATIYADPDAISVGYETLRRNGRGMDPVRSAPLYHSPPVAPPPPPPPPPPSPPPPAPTAKQKPPPPKRSESTRLSSPARRSFSSPAGPGQIACPPDVFLKDLHRVMEKKWKVAQQLSSEPLSTPHEILGFRDPRCLPPPAESDYDHGTAHRKKMPPPPPPKRSDATQLSRWQC